VRLRRRRGSDRGAATVDFVLVGALVTLMFLAVLQLGIDFYVRNVLAACLADGARYGANSDIASPAAAANRANQEIRQTLGSAYATAQPAPSADLAGATAVRVTAWALLPLLAWFLPFGPVVHANGEALMEPHG
jgi:Flp pilus assembly protein TadG